MVGDKQVWASPPFEAAEAGSPHCHRNQPPIQMAEAGAARWTNFFLVTADSNGYIPMSRRREYIFAIFLIQSLFQQKCKKNKKIPEAGTAARPGRV